MSFKGDCNESVGYKRPPSKDRFKKGQSGNPAGRPKAKPDVITAIDRELNERIVVTENGRTRTMTKATAIAKQTVNRAIKGDPAATRALRQYGLQRQRRGALNAIKIEQEDVRSGGVRFEVLSPEENDQRLLELLIKAGYEPPPTESDEPE